MREHAKTGARTKKREGEGEKERNGEKRAEITENPLFRNLRGRWRPQYPDWPVLTFPSTGHNMLASRVSRLL